ncbi:NUDIX hydrolase [Adhaeribacter swui]|uniref:NUDIX hydrolase n=1 Tax=Adhaeribacter swui TaxID=2086471 RepID=A0A7G7GA68_9BACT|nr:NUDIX domain-containing protein [Adhaeribacter swui]QNF34052.1 NUDIX hydrolase [Adhaeribacter swui]
MVKTKFAGSILNFKPEDIIPSVSTDCVIFGLDNGKLKVLLLKRNIEPSPGLWALPGGFVLDSEELEHSAMRTLHDTTGMSNVFMEQVQAFGQVNRFPWRRVITIVFYALIKYRTDDLKAGPDASEINWFDIADLPELVFDHKHILNVTLQHLQSKVRSEPIGFELLPPKFTLTQLQELYEAVLRTTFDTRNFRKKLLKMNLLEQLDETQIGVAHRAARLYRFNSSIYLKLKEKGFTFEL